MEKEKGRVAPALLEISSTFVLSSWATIAYFLLASSKRVLNFSLDSYLEAGETAS
jgi:hypothetical protein